MNRVVSSSMFVSRMNDYKHINSLVLLALLVNNPLHSRRDPMTRRRGILHRAYDVVVPAKFGCRRLLNSQSYK